MVIGLLPVQTPGPGHYGMPETDVYKKKSPGFTMISRHDSSSKDITPGPGAHSNDNVIISLSLSLPCPLSESVNQLHQSAEISDMT